MKPLTLCYSEWEWERGVERKSFEKQWTHLGLVACKLIRRISARLKVDTHREDFRESGHTHKMSQVNWTIPPLHPHTSRGECQRWRLCFWNFKIVTSFTLLSAVPSWGPVKAVLLLKGNKFGRTTWSVFLWKILVNVIGQTNKPKILFLRNIT